MSRQLLASMEENLAGHVAYVQRRLAGMFVDDREDLLIVDSGLPTDTFNKILRARLDAGNADTRIEEALDHFRAVQRPFAWWIGPLAQPADIEDRLQRHGLRPAETELGMSARLDQLPAALELPPGLEIRAVTTQEQLEHFCAIQAANWDPPDRIVYDFFAQAVVILLTPDCPMRLYVGYLEGEPAAGAELFLGGGAAGIHMVSTRREFQRRGIGFAMTWHAAREGARVGMRTAVLQASDQGAPVYARLGFETVCRFIEYQQVT